MWAKIILFIGLGKFYRIYSIKSILILYIAAIIHQHRRLIMFIFPTPFPTHPLIFSQMAGKRAWGAWENLQEALSLYYLCTRIRKRFHGLSQRQKWRKVLHTTPYHCKTLCYWRLEVCNVNSDTTPTLHHTTPRRELRKSQPTWLLTF